MITDRDFKFITKFESLKRGDELNEFVQANGHQTAETFMSMLGSLSKDQAIQYILCLINDIFLENKDNVNIFLDYFAEKKSGTNGPSSSLWQHFFALLHREDAFIQNMVCSKYKVLVKNRGSLIGDKRMFVVLYHYRFTSIDSPSVVILFCIIFPFPPFFC